MGLPGSQEPGWGAGRGARAQKQTRRVCPQHGLSARGCSGSVLAPRVAQHRADPVYVEGDASKEVGVLVGGAPPDHKGVHALDDSVADQGAARVPLGRGQVGQSLRPGQQPDEATSGEGAT